MSENNGTVKRLLEKNKLFVIIRGVYGEDLMKLVGALYDGGVRLAEITFEQDKTECGALTSAAISAASDFMRGKMVIGAGTVLTVGQVLSAKTAGAKFIVSPNVNAELIRCVKREGLIAVPGAVTPTEIMTANAAGADYVKIFPAGQFGTEYIKSVKTPLGFIKYVATAGVDENNITELMRAGYTAVGVGGRLADHALIDVGDFATITERARVFVDLLK